MAKAKKKPARKAPRKQAKKKVQAKPRKSKQRITAKNPTTRKRSKGPNVIWTKEVKAEFVGALKISGFVGVALDILQLPESSLYGAMNADPVFKRQVKAAKAIRKQHSLKVLHDEKSWQAHAWFLERTDNKNFGRRVALNHEGEINATITVKREDFKGLTNDELAAMLERIEEKEAEEEIKEAEIIQKELAES